MLEKAISLMYHDVVEPGQWDASGRVGPGAAKYKIDSKEFVKHLQAVARVRSDSPMLATALTSVPRPSTAPLLLTFDDGGRGACQTADLLESQGWRGHFFITVGDLGGSRFLSHSQVRDLSSRGHAVGSHTYSHPELLSGLSSGAILEEWKRSTTALSDLIGEQVTTGSVPGGFTSRRVYRAAAEAGITILFTSEPTVRCRWAEGCTVLGRYTVVRGTSARHVARLALARPAPCARQYIAWNLKKAGKLAGGQYYVKFRRLVTS
jgi:hypothetical protein